MGLFCLPKFRNSAESNKNYLKENNQNLFSSMRGSPKKDVGTITTYIAKQACPGGERMMCVAKTAQRLLLITKLCTKHLLTH